MNFGTKLRTILAVATCLNTALMSVDLTGFANAYVDMGYKIVSIVLNFIIVALVTWFNNDYTVEAETGTLMVRAMKASSLSTVDHNDEPEDSEVQ